MSDIRYLNPVTGAKEMVEGQGGAMRVQTSPVVAYYSGTVGADHAVSGVGLRLINDTAETIRCTVGSIVMDVKQNEDINEYFAQFAQVTVDPTTSLGTAQIETATLAEGAVTVAGNMATIITAAGMGGTPKTILTAVTTADDTPAKIMTKVRASIAADTAVAALFTASGADADIVLTRDKVRPIANDGTLNIDLGGTGTTAVGITRVATSTNTEAGVAATAIGYRLWVRG